MHFLKQPVFLPVLLVFSNVTIQCLGVGEVGVAQQ